MLRTPEGSPEEADIGKDAGPVGLATGDGTPGDDSGQVHRAVLQGPGYVTGGNLGLKVVLKHAMVH